MLTEELFKQLEPLESSLLSAYKSQFIRNIDANEFELVKSIYVSLTNSSDIFKLHCSSCIINLYARMGKLYFDYKESKPILYAVSKTDAVKIDEDLFGIKPVEPVEPIKVIKKNTKK